MKKVKEGLFSNLALIEGCYDLQADGATWLAALAWRLRRDLARQATQDHVVEELRALQQNSKHQGYDFDDDPLDLSFYFSKFPIIDGFFDRFLFGKSAPVNCLSPQHCNTHDVVIMARRGGGLNVWASGTWDYVNGLARLHTA